MKTYYFVLKEDFQIYDNRKIEKIIFGYSLEDKQVFIPTQINPRVGYPEHFICLQKLEDLGVSIKNSELEILRNNENIIFLDQIKVFVSAHITPGSANEMIEPTFWCVSTKQEIIEAMIGINSFTNENLMILDLEIDTNQIVLSKDLIAHFNEIAEKF